MASRIELKKPSFNFIISILLCVLSGQGGLAD